MRVGFYLFLNDLHDDWGSIQLVAALQISYKLLYALQAPSPAAEAGGMNMTVIH